MKVVCVWFCTFFPACHPCGLKFRARLAVEPFSRSKAYLGERAFSVPVRAAPSPDFLGESASAIGRRLVDDLASDVSCASSVLQNCLYILREGFRAGVKLAGSPAYAGACHLQPNPCVVRLAKPAEVFWRVVPLVAIAVIHN